MTITANCPTDNCPVQNFTVTAGQSFACPVCHVAGNWIDTSDAAEPAPAPVVAAEAPVVAAEAPVPNQVGFQKAQEFAEALNTKFGPGGYYVFGATKGRKFHRITQTPKLGAGMSVHAFVNNDGWVFKAEGWKAPAKGVRFTSVEAAVEAADPHGGYLYLKG